MKNEWDLDSARWLLKCLSLSFLGATPVYAITLWLTGTKDITTSHILVASGLLFMSIIFILSWGILGIKRGKDGSNT